MKNTKIIINILDGRHEEENKKHTEEMFSVVQDCLMRRHDVGQSLEYYCEDNNIDFEKSSIKAIISYGSENS